MATLQLVQQNHASCSSTQSTGEQDTGLQVLGLVLGHLSSRDGDPQLWNVAARGLHRTSKHFQAAARATLRHLHLDRRYVGLRTHYPDPDSWPPLLPLDMLEACPGVTSWALHVDQLSAFTRATVKQLAAAASKLKRLEVKGQLPVWRPPEPGTGSDEQLRRLGRLLRVTTQLEELDTSFTGDTPWLVLDPTSSSLETAQPPPLPLRSWRSAGGLHGLLPHWAGKQQQLSSTLSKVDMEGFGDDPYDVSGLAALRGLKDLRLDKVNITSATALTALTGLTSLHVPGSQEAVCAACALTGLRHLSLAGHGPSVSRSMPPQHSLLSSISALKQLQSLELHGAEYPADLGQWLPGLQRLKMVQLPLAAVPAGLTRLTHLQLINRDGSDVTLPTSLTSLRELTVAVPGCTSIRGLTNQAGLQRLHVACVPSSIMLADLGSLTSLRHLELSGEYRGDPGALTVFGSLQQLTHLTLCGSLLVGVLEHAHRAPPHLQELVVTGTFERFSVAALERWLRQLPALRKLRVDGCMLNGAIESLHLPEGLQELTLRMIPYMQQLPAALSGLSTLRMLDVSGNTDLEQLPACLSGLRSLEEVNWEGNPVNTQQVLADMPGLRRVWVLNTLCFFVTFGKGAALDRKLWHWHVSATRNVYGAATHLHYGGLRPL